MPPVPCPPRPRHPDLYGDADSYSRKEIDDIIAKLPGATAYQKPETGIPGTDLASDVQASLGKADTALQEHQDISDKADLVGGNVPSSELPSYVDDVLEFDTKENPAAGQTAFPATGEAGKIYVAKDTNKTYRWSGTQYVQVGGDSVPVAPSTDASASGKPADAKATGDELALRAYASDLTMHVEDSVAHVTSSDKTAWNAKQNALTFDNSPTANSNNPVKSSGIKSALDNKADKVASPVGGELVGISNNSSFSLVSTGIQKSAVAKSSAIANPWSMPSVDYPVGTYVTHEGLLYVCTAIPNHTRTPGVGSNNPWSPVKVVDRIPAAQVNSDWNAASGVAQILNKPTIPDVSGKADASSIAPAFSSSSTYAVGDYVTREGLLYKCTTAVATAGAWNAANWTAVAVTDEMGADTPLPFDAEIEYIENYRCTLPLYAAGELDVQSEIYFADGYTGNDFAIGKWMSAKCYCIYMDSSKLVARYNNSSTATINKTTGEWKAIGIHGGVFYYGDTTQAITRAVFGDEQTTIEMNCGTDVRIRSLKVGIVGGAPVLDLVPVRVGQIGYLYDKISGALFATKKSNDPTIGPDKATPTITTPGRIVELTDSPAFTGTPTAPTAAAGTNTTQVATTAFVQSAIAALRSELGLT